MPTCRPSVGEGDGEGKADMAAAPYHYDVQVKSHCWLPCFAFI